MPTWGQILGEVNSLIPKYQGNTFNIIRNKYVKALSDSTGRDTIVYLSRWASGDAPPMAVSITDEDIHAFMEAIAGLKNDKLDLILHTGGGSAETTDAIVSYLRQKFNHIRVIIPQAAMSAGTMLACAADEIIMGRQSSIGPIDPQFILQTAVGIQSIPAHAIIKQFMMAQDDCAKNPKNLNSWMPMLSQYGPALLVRCQDQIEFGRQLVEKWLYSYMFKGENHELSKKIAHFLSHHDNFKTHGKHINMDDAQNLGLKIIRLEDNQEFQDRVLSAFHASMIPFGMTNTAKVIANQNGNCFLKQFAVQMPVPINVKPSTPGGPPTHISM
jgi:hypothetical protein